MSDPQATRIRAAKRLGCDAEGWLGDGRHSWWTSWSPRNANMNAEGQWCQWVHLARLILAHDLTKELMPGHHQPYPDPPSLYDECHPDCRADSDDPAPPATGPTIHVEQTAGRWRLRILADNGHVLAFAAEPSFQAALTQLADVMAQRAVRQIVPDARPEP